MALAFFVCHTESKIFILCKYFESFFKIYTISASNILHLSFFSFFPSLLRGGRTTKNESGYSHPCAVGREISCGRD